MKLYFSPGACSLAAHITLNEVGAKFQLSKADIRNKKTETGDDYLKVNPKGQVPTLETDDGKTLTECAAILQYVADTHPEKNLLPKHGTWERHKANEWLTYISSEMHKGMGAFFAVDRMVSHPEGKKEYHQNLTTALGKKFDYLSESLKNNQFLLGNQFSAADAYLFTILNWHGLLRVDLKPWPALMGYMERVKSRPAVQKSMKEEGLI